MSMTSSLKDGETGGGGGGEMVMVERKKGSVGLMNWLTKFKILNGYDYRAYVEVVHHKSG